jgi:hypothetical protein
MGRLIGRAPALATDAIDIASAALAAAWPRSLAAREVGRLTEDGYTAGEVCNVDFALALDRPELADMALSAAALAGFTPLDRTPDAHGFVTMRAPVRLRAYDLVRAASRLNRAVKRYGGFAEVIGPERRAPEGDGTTGRAA